MSEVQGVVEAEPSLADIFSGKEEPEAVAEPEAPEAPEKPQKERDEQGKFTAKEPEKAPVTEPETAEQVEDKPKGKPDGIGALIAERRKRQELEKQLEAVKTEKPKPDFYADPEKSIEEAVSAQTAKLREQYFRNSVKLAQFTPGRTDYEEVAQAFAEAAEKDPRLYEQLRADDDPGEFIYTVGKQIHELADVNGDIGAYREKVTAELTGQLSDRDKRIAALEAELAASKKQYEDLSTVGRSLNQTGSGRAPSVADTDDDDLKSIVRFGNK